MLTEFQIDFVEEAAEDAVRQGYTLCCIEGYAESMRTSVEFVEIDFDEFLKLLRQEVSLILPIWQDESMNRAFNDDANHPGINGNRSF